MKVQKRVYRRHLDAKGQLSHSYDGEPDVLEANTRMGISVNHVFGHFEIEAILAKTAKRGPGKSEQQAGHRMEFLLTDEECEFLLDLLQVYTRQRRKQSRKGA